MKAAIHERIGLRPSGAPPESPMDSARMPPLQIALADLIAALDWAGHTGSDRMAFVCRETGRIVRTSDRDFDDAGASLGDTPADLHDPQRYAIIPSHRDLQLGKRLAVRFAQAHAPQVIEDVHACFAAAGARERFDALMMDAGQHDAWRAHETAAVEAALREWAEGEGLMM